MEKVSGIKMIVRKAGSASSAKTEDALREAV